MTESDLILAEIQSSAARHLRWLMDRAEVVDGTLVCSGWALSPLHPPEDVHFLLNGEHFEQVSWPLPSVHLAEHFAFVQRADLANFTCRQKLRAGAFDGGYARISILNRFGEHRQSYRHNWYVPNPVQRLPIPDPERIFRVIGVRDQKSYLLGGATIVNRLNGLLQDRFGRPLSSFRSALDWGCGSGRLTRHMIEMAGDGCEIVGADIDDDNVVWCRHNLAGGMFVTVPLQPPTRFRDGEFELVTGCSVMTHLAEDEQFRWLKELARITERGAISMLSIEGRSQLALYKGSPDLYLKIQSEGFVVTGQNAQLDGMIDDAEYYKNIYHSHEYILAKWQEHFDVIEIVEAIAGNQDLVVLRRR